MFSNMKQHRIKKSSGMTLLEVLVSMLLIGSALGMSLSMIQSSLQFERNALRQGIFMDALEELTSLVRSNKYCVTSYVFNGFGVRDNGRADPTFTNNSCNANGYENEDLIANSHNQARADINNWLSDLMQHFPQTEAQRRNSSITYDQNEKTLTITIRYSQTPETASLAGDGAAEAEATFTKTVKL